MTANVRSHWPVFWFFQFSHKPASPKTGLSFIAMAKGCFARAPLIAFHEEAINGHNAATKRVSLSEHR
jgi:hypothetical protein